jgi:hypothetical protein
MEDYLILDGKDSVVDGDFTLVWRDIPSGFFNKPDNNSRIVLTPMYLNFCAIFDFNQTFDYENESRSVTLESNLSGSNIKQTGKNFLLMTDVIIDLSNIVTQNISNITNPIPLVLGEIRDVEIKLKYMNDYLFINQDYDTSGDYPFKDLFKLIFKITYV